MPGGPVLLLLVWLPAALAQQPPGEEVIVRAEESVLHARARLEQALLATGFRRAVRKADRTVFPRTALWKTRVVLHDDGLIELRTPGLVPMAGAPWIELDDFGQPEAGGLDWGGLATGARALRQPESRILEATSQELASWRRALWARNLAERRAVRAEEARVAWFEGRTPDGQPLPDAAQRRAWLLQSWLATADSPDGAAVRADLLRFFEDVVQASGDPFTTLELDAANGQRSFAQALELGG